jgi:23S rRNA pseudouridine955/2504/2580 synthase
VVVLAKSSASAGIYGRHVKETGLDKLYLALVEGRPVDKGVISEPLDGKESETRYDILTTGNGCTLLAVVPISGRMHQIRRHLEMTGHPVVGDKRYGGRILTDYEGFALHSFKTVLERPDAPPLTVCAPLPESLLQLCEQSGIETGALLQSVQRIAGILPSKEIQ